MDKPIEYEQTDSRWRNIMYSSIGNRADTIGNSGCGPTCAAMVVATLRDRKVNPENAAKWMMANGGVSPHDGTYWSAIGKYLAYWDIPYTQTNSDVLAKEALEKHYMVITAMGVGDWTRGGHFILAYGIKNNKILIHDPNSEASYREQGDMNRFFTQEAQYWIVREEWYVDLREVEIVSKDTGNKINLKAIMYEGENYVRLRDVPKIAPLQIGYEDGKPTFDLVYK